ncbi:MAG: RimK family alpha-L-glutamate ligase [Acidobacteriota bacterium]
MLIGVLSRKPNLYSTRRLVEAAGRRGHRAVVLDPLQCYLVVETSAPAIFYRRLSVRLDQVDVVLPRIGASITEHGLAVVNQFDMMGVALVNNSQPIARSRDKLRALQLLSRAGVPVPRSVVARHPSQARRALEFVGGAPAIVKLLKGTQGIGVVLAETEQIVMQVMETFWRLGMNVLIQEFVEESEGRDIRALVIGDRVACAMRRQARLGEFRSNVHRGGTGVAVDLPAEYAGVAIRAARTVGLRLAGVDMLESKQGPKVMEVNSSPGLERLEACCGVDVAGAVVEYAAGLARRRRRPREGSGAAWHTG